AAPGARDKAADLTSAAHPRKVDQLALALLSEFAIPLNVMFNCVPTIVIAAMQMTMMSAAINPYSTAVAPPSSRINLESTATMCISLNGHRFRHAAQWPPLSHQAFLRRARSSAIRLKYRTNAARRPYLRAWRGSDYLPVCLNTALSLRIIFQTMS